MKISALQMDDVLVALHNVDEAKRSALAARTRHFKRLGFPEGANVGRGRTSFYGIGQLIDLLLAFELSQFGVNPERVVEILSAAKYLSKPIVRDYLDRLSGSQPPSLIIHIDPRAADSLSARNPAEDHDLLDMVENDAVFFAENWLTDANRFHWRRRALIDATTLMREAAHVLAHLGICSPEELYDAMEAFDRAAKIEAEKELKELLDGDG